MPPILADTFGGLSIAYYSRQLVFGAGISALLYFLVGQGQPESLPTILYFFLPVNALLYPYARFLYEEIVGFLVGDNDFYFPVFIVMIVKLHTILLCWSFAIFMAPFGLLYLYFCHRRAKRQAL